MRMLRERGSEIGGCWSGIGLSGLWITLRRMRGEDEGGLGVKVIGFSWIGELAMENRGWMGGYLRP